ncbi:MAG TPA: RdgB/HAM1 family non-canonical purine NTP pyrophosphatase [Candidatus Nitrosocosmicus sp.]|nr:RdgB/HAM1 family non-canonical purine NTP pyrophosphatase [Candidatus Nitrosocosmicus sp.]
MTEPLIFITSNKGKAEEAKSILEFPIEVYDLELDEIQSLSLEKIAIKKAEYAFKLVQKPLIVDDVGVFVHAWKGFPGPFIKYLQQIGLDVCLKMLSTETNREATVKAVIGYHDGTLIHTFVGEVKGTISHEVKGPNGWGWDPIFIPEGQNKTYAEMSTEEKNSISHRRKVLDELKKYLAVST